MADPPTVEQLSTAVTAAGKSAKDAQDAAANAASAASKASAAASSASSAVEAPWKPPSKLFTYLVIAIVFFGSLISVSAIKNALAKTPWSLADALSEETQVTLFKEVEDPVTKIKSRTPERDANGNLITVTDLRASTSRVIALMGMIVLIFLFIGFGVFTLYSYAVTGRIPASIDKAINFMVAGLTLFAPYLVNKFASLFQGITSGK